jgi:hypothetical protein
MPDQDLVMLLEKAFLPYARAYAAEDPGAVELDVVCTATQVRGTLRYAQLDHDALSSGSMAEVDIGRAFRALASWNDGRQPSLVIRLIA